MFKNRGGFTLFEVMITMTVSASMLVVAIVLFSGQQQKTQFSQGMRDLESSFQDIINDTATGYFPKSTLSCTSDPASGPVFDAAISAEQGSSQDCIFLGKAIHIMADHMDVYPVVGDGSITSTTTFQSAKPVVVPKATAPTLVDNKQFLWGLKVKHIYWNTTATDHLNDGALIAIVSSPNGTGTDTVGQGLNSGIQKISVLSSGPSPNTPVDYGSSSAATETDINTAFQNSSFAWPTGDKVTICFQDDNGQKGGIVISGGESSINASIVTDTDAVGCS